MNKENFLKISKDYIALTKPKVISLLLVTAISGMFLANGSTPSLILIIIIIVGGTLASGGAGAINHFIDKDVDQLMKRTSNRPVASNRVTPNKALSFGVFLTILSFIILYFGSNFLAAILAILGNVFYVFIYSLWLKKTTSHNIVIGGIAGCFPPLVGWAAVTGSLSLPAWYLFAIIFFWTPPHFWALAMLMNEDYKEAKIPMLPTIIGFRKTQIMILTHTIILIALTLALTIVSSNLGIIYLLGSIILGVMYLNYTIRLIVKYTTKKNLGLYKFSLLYLFLICMTIIIDSSNIIG